MSPSQCARHTEGKSKQPRPQQFPFQRSMQWVPGTRAALFLGGVSKAMLNWQVRFTAGQNCLDILALLTASLTTDGQKTFIMLQRAELQTIRKTVKSLTPSKPMCQTRACPEPVSQRGRAGVGVGWGWGTEEVMVKTKEHPLTAQPNSRHSSRHQTSSDPPKSWFSILTVQSLDLIRSCIQCAFFLIFPKCTVRLPLPLEKENLAPANSQAPSYLPSHWKLGGEDHSLILTPRFKWLIQICI